VFFAFLRLGVTAFGGPATVAYIREMVVRRRGWVREAVFARGIALAQSIPGATAMQTAAYAGLRAGGVRGALAAYVGFGLPAFLLMVVLAAGYSTARTVPAVASTFSGLRVIVVALVAHATVSFGRRTLKRPVDILLAAATAGFLAVGGPPIIAIVAAIAVAAALYRDPGPPAPVEAAPAVPAPSTGRVTAVLALLFVAAIAALWLIDPLLFSIALVMVKVDLFAFGGGFASVPLLLHEVVEHRHWLDHDVFMDGIALGQVTPGPIVITATFAGYLIAGLPGAVVATISIFGPSFLMVLALAPHFDRLQRHAPFRRGVRGALVSFVGLLLAVTFRFALAAPWSASTALLGAAAFTALTLGVDVLWVVLAGAAISAIIGSV
jgi:chromate transporter